jgi:protein-S-isoprenylcysteine O-methyltransferase Ste14
MLLRAILSFIALPGIFALVVPPFVAYWDPWNSGHWMPGVWVMAAGAFVLLWCVRDFYVAGIGTLAPWDPPKHLVVQGLYRFVRNPMYIGVLLLVLGWSLLFLSPLLFLYATSLAIGFHLRVVKYEEPKLKAQFGRQWVLYRQSVPRWRPRIVPWRDGA